jgi:branched-chain amino acid transport system substrate-binding protein
MKSIRKPVFALFAILVAAAALPEGAWSADPGVTKDKVTLGSFLPLQSGLAAGATQMKEGCDAYFKYINDSGGVNGRKIEWIVENDSYNPQQTAAVVKKLVDRDGVFAIVSTPWYGYQSRRSAISGAARRTYRQSGWRAHVAQQADR